jgi:hypothetical protein
MLRLALVACALALASCGDDAATTTAPPAAELTVTVRPEGPGGAVRERRVECGRVGPGAAKPVCRQLSAGRLAPVPRTTPCTAIYGGPFVARVAGTLRGEHVDARFSLEDGCEIARWERNRSLLGEPG